MRIIAESSLLLCLPLLSLAWVPAVPAQCVIVETDKLTAADADAGDHFGHSVSVSGDVTVVGSRYDDDAGTDAGAAYVIRYDGTSWVQEQKLIASDTNLADEFGISVSVDGDVALVGAKAGRGNGGNVGSAYVFRYDGSSWEEEQKLIASDASPPNDSFGNSAALRGTVAIVGAPHDDGSGVRTGAAYIYRYDGATWNEEQKLTASDAALDDLFGWAVSVDGDVAVAGARFDDDGGDIAGSAYVYRFNGASWVEEQKLAASAPEVSMQFGHSVSVDGATVLVGGPGTLPGGAAYVFGFDGATWTQDHTLTASDAAPVDQFGIAVSLRGDTALVGAYFDNEAAPNTGSAYAFRFDGSTWFEQWKLVVGDAVEEHQLGHAVSVDGGRAFVSSRLDDEGGLEAGAAYVYEIEPLPDCNANGILDSCDIASGTSEDVNGDGAPDECGDIDGDGSVGQGDLLIVLGGWGPCPDPPDECAADLDGDGDVNVLDLLIVLANWG